MPSVFDEIEKTSFAPATPAAPAAPIRSVFDAIEAPTAVAAQTEPRSVFDLVQPSGSDPYRKFARTVEDRPKPPTFAEVLDDPERGLMGTLWGLANVPLIDQERTENWLGEEWGFTGGFARGTAGIASSFSTPLSLLLLLGGPAGRAVGIFKPGGATLLAQATAKGGAAMSASEIAAMTKGAQIMHQAAKRGLSAAEGMAAARTAGVDPALLERGSRALLAAGLDEGSLLYHGFVRRATTTGLQKLLGTGPAAAEKAAVWTQLAADAAFTAQDFYWAMTASPRFFEGFKTYAEAKERGDEETAAQALEDLKEFGLTMGVTAGLGIWGLRQSMREANMQVREAGSQMDASKAWLGLNVKPSAEVVAIRKIYGRYDRAKLTEGRAQELWANDVRAWTADFQGRHPDIDAQAARKLFKSPLDMMRVYNLIESGRDLDVMAQRQAVLQRAVSPEEVAPLVREATELASRTAPLDVQYREAAEQGGADYRGIQRGAGALPDHVLFDDPETGSTLALPVDEATPSRIAQRVLESRAKYPIKSPETWAPQAEQLIGTTGGVTWNPRTGRVRRGFVGEIYPEGRQVLDHPAAAADIRSFYERHEPLFRAHPELAIGAFENQLEVSGVAPTLAAANRVFRQLDQESIIDASKTRPDGPPPDDAFASMGGQGKTTAFPDYPLERRLADLRETEVGELASRRFPTTEVLSKQYGQTENVREAGLIGPDGQMVSLGGRTHFDMIGERPGPDADPRIDYINETGTVRSRFRVGRAGSEYVFSIPERGVTPEQTARIQDAAQTVPNGRITLETANRRPRTAEIDFPTRQEIADQLSRLSEAQELAARAPRLSSLEHELKNLTGVVKNVSEVPDDGSYLLTDGTFTKSDKTTSHATLAEKVLGLAPDDEDATMEFMNETGAIRVGRGGRFGKSGSVYIQINRPPTAEQVAALKSFAKTGTSIDYDVFGPSGTGIAASEYGASFKKFLRDLGEVQARWDESGELASRAPGFYSKAAEVVRTKLPDVGSGDQFLATLRNNGVRADELKWTGLDDFLAEHKKVTKKEVQDFLRENEVQVEEIEKSGIQKYPAGRIEYMETNGKYRVDYPGLQAEVFDSRPEARAKLDELQTKFGQPATKFAQWQTPGGTNYRELLLTLPVRPLPVTIGQFEPFNKTGVAMYEGKQRVEGVFQADFSAGKDEGHITYWPKSFDHLGNERGPEYVVYSANLQNAHFKTAGEAVQAIKKSAALGDIQRASGETFRGGHWDEPNVLAHVRLNDRVDADGRRTLFIEEVQSDWHQAGRKKGYQTRGGSEMEQKRNRLASLLEESNRYPSEKELADYFVPGRVVHGYGGFDKVLEFRPGDPSKPYPHNTWTVKVIAVDADGTPQRGERERVHATLPEFAARHPEAFRELQELRRETTPGTGVPDAPFKSTWHELAMKRVLRYAAENGYERVAWTTGEQQAARYDLSKQVDSIVTARKDDGTYRVEALKGGSVVVDQIVPETGLAGLIGKDLADKAAAAPRGAQKWVGENLKVGGEGMRGFYDRILPGFMNKYGKKWGARVGETELPTGGEAYRIIDHTTGEVFEGGLSRQVAIDHSTNYEGARVEKEAAPTSVHSIDVTPEMRKSGMEEGQPLFARGVRKPDAFDAPEEWARSVAAANFRYEPRTADVPGRIKTDVRTQAILESVTETKGWRGLTIAGRNVRTTIDALGFLQQHAERYNPAAARKIGELREALGLASRENPHGVAIVPTAAAVQRHELTHVVQLEGGHGFWKRHADLDRVAAAPEMKSFEPLLGRLGYDVEDRPLLAVEAATHIMAGQLPAGTPKQRADFLATYFESVYEHSGPETLRRFDRLVVADVRPVLETVRLRLEQQRSVNAELSRLGREGVESLGSQRAGTREGLVRGEGRREVASRAESGDPGGVGGDRGFFRPDGTFEPLTSGTHYDYAEKRGIPIQEGLRPLFDKGWIRKGDQGIYEARLTPENLSKIEADLVRDWTELKAAEDRIGVLRWVLIEEPGAGSGKTWKSGRSFKFRLREVEDADFKLPDLIETARNRPREFASRSPQDETKRITPDRFLERAEVDLDLLSEKNLEKVRVYREAIREGRTVEPAEITLDQNGRVIGHDGVLRALAQKQEGKTSMPVRVHRLGTPDEEIRYLESRDTPPPMNPDKAEGPMSERRLEQLIQSGKLRNSREYTRKQLAELVESYDPGKITPEHRAIAKEVGAKFDENLERGQDWGVLGEGTDNYVTHLWGKNRDNPAARMLIHEGRTGRFSVNTTMARKRMLDSAFEGQLLGLRLNKTDPVALAAFNGAEFGRIAAARQFVDTIRSTNVQASDGRPMVVLSGTGSEVEGAIFANPKSVRSIKIADKVVAGLRQRGELDALIERGDIRKRTDSKGATIYAWDPSDYRTIDSKAMQGWNYISAAPDGTRVYLKGDLKVHPEAYTYLNRLLGAEKSLMHEVPAFRALQKVAREAKAILLFGDTFHYAQEGLRAIMTGVSPFGVDKWDLRTDPMLSKMVEGGLTLGTDYGHIQNFEEGLMSGPSAVLEKIPVLREWQHWLETYLFEKYIPSLKARASKKLFVEYKTRYPEWTLDKVAEEAAADTNERFGGLNYTRMGRKVATQDAMRLLALAPDWFESEVRFMARAFGDEGRVARIDLAKVAVGLWAAARIMNELTTGDPHNEAPFGVVIKDDDGNEKIWTLRTIPSDMIHAVHDPSGFIAGRASPLYRAASQTYMGRDEFGRKLPAQQLPGSLLLNTVPIFAQSAYKERVLKTKPETTTVEQFSKTAGLSVYPYKTEASRKAAELASNFSPDGPVDSSGMKLHVLKMKWEDDIRGGRMKPQELYDMVVAGDVAPADAKAVMRGIKETQGMTPDESRFYRRASRLPAPEFLKIWDIASADEKALLARMLIKKRNAYFKKIMTSMTPKQRLADPTLKRFGRMFESELPF